MTTMDTNVIAGDTTWAEICAECGDYEQRAPAGAREIDGPFARSRICADCHIPMAYRPMTRGKSYRAFAVCGRCGKAVEF